MEKIIDGKRRKRKRSVWGTLRALSSACCARARNGGRSPPTSAPGRPSTTTSASGGTRGCSNSCPRFWSARRSGGSAGGGIDGNKKVNGRKQHVVTDSLGLVIGAAVHPANVHDSKGVMLVLEGLRGASRRLTRVIADGGRGGGLADRVMERLGARLEVTKQPKLPGRDFVPAGRRWVAGRTFAWMENFRRLTIDYEFRSDSTVAMIYLANCRIALNKVLKHTP